MFYFIYVSKKSGLNLVDQALTLALKDWPQASISWFSFALVLAISASFTFF